MKEVYVLTIHDEDTFQILGIYDYLKTTISEKGEYCYSLSKQTTKAIIKHIDKQEEEIERLNNIINELEKELFIKKEFYERELCKRPTNDSEYNTQYADSCALAQICVIYDKLQELKRK